MMAGGFGIDTFGTSEDTGHTASQDFYRGLFRSDTNLT